MNNSKPTGVSLDPARLDFDKGGGLVPVVVQDDHTLAVLMLAYTDRQALDLTLSTGEMHFHSRKRGLWKKGETSGNTLRVVSLASDCDHDTILARVVPAGPTCHEGTTTCFGEPELEPLSAVDRVVAARAAEAPGAGDKPSYTQKLLGDRNLRLKKLGEETAELLVALVDGDKERIGEEGADLLYHLIVALHGAGLSLDTVREVLRARRAR